MNAGTGILIIVAVVYLGLIASGYYLRKRLLDKCGNYFLSLGCQVTTGSIFNPLNFCLRIFYKDRVFLLFETQAYKKPLDTNIAYQAVLQTTLHNVSFWNVQSRVLLKKIPDSQHYYIIGNSLARRLTQEEFDHLDMKAGSLLEEVFQTALMVE